MRELTKPPRNAWSGLVNRPSSADDNVRSVVREILNDVRDNGDNAVGRYTAKFDGARLDTFEVATSGAGEKIDPELKDAIRIAIRNVETFHREQILVPRQIQTQKGVTCWREARPIDPVGLYVPGGSAPLFSSLIMLGVPAAIAGCRNIIVCTPPSADGEVSAVIRYVAAQLGIERVFAVGGAQAIGAMAYGTDTVPKVHKIFGPGNAYVTAAKQLIQNDGVSIDMPAGPSELLVIADDSADPSFVAADLLSQAEHGPDSQVILATDSRAIIDETLAQIQKQLQNLPRKEIAEKALQQSLVIEFSSIEESIEFSNCYAPEHLILNCRSPRELLPAIEAAGSVFIGPWSCESLGDYASGTNHTLPTAGYARNYSGVSVDSFVKKITFQEVDRDGLFNLGPTVQAMALAEGLAAHERAVSIRIKKNGDD